jgi:hypothetical protein
VTVGLLSHQAMRHPVIHSCTALATNSGPDRYSPGICSDVPGRLGSKYGAGADLRKMLEASGLDLAERIWIMRKSEHGNSSVLLVDRVWDLNPGGDSQRARNRNFHHSQDR